MRYNTKRYWGYSTDVKPINAQIGDRFLETDTQLEYFFSDFNQWKVINPLKYKVFTALLTQSGGDNIVSTYNGGPSIIVGVTYTIADNNGNGWDFTNIGAPNNNIGTSFIATGTIPNNWGIDAQLDYNTGAPVATVLENTIGNVWFTYESLGGYGIKSNDLFINNKTFILYSPFSADNSDVTANVLFYKDSVNLINIVIGDGNGFLSGTPIEIRVYN
jgi:hypothetical protein